ncbi:hypothetical protein Hypma_006067 [Hypsizygus marmoreus]|uniref:Uncharacterized protein n=1 Tax=Hypsizygus marmoreus TaxID=39966 RepID=A0A369JX29_HYPMA|nr:hypothetical protein Hypma_006067 [Hypsizygus marmoreus]
MGSTPASVHSAVDPIVGPLLYNRTTFRAPQVIPTAVSLRACLYGQHYPYDVQELPLRCGWLCDGEMSTFVNFENTSSMFVDVYSATINCDLAYFAFCAPGYHMLYLSERRIRRLIASMVLQSTPKLRIRRDTEPVIGNDKVIEEPFVNVFCALMYGGGWVDLETDEKLDRDYNCALVPQSFRYVSFFIHSMLMICHHPSTDRVQISPTVLIHGPQQHFYVFYYLQFTCEMPPYGRDTAILPPPPNTEHFRISQSTLVRPSVQQWRVHPLPTCSYTIRHSSAHQRMGDLHTCSDADTLRPRPPTPAFPTTRLPPNVWYICDLGHASPWASSNKREHHSPSGESISSLTQMSTDLWPSPSQRCVNVLFLHCSHYHLTDLL